MTTEQLEQAFDEALNKWLQLHPDSHLQTQAIRYFFWAGSEFGVKTTANIYSETFQRPRIVEQVQEQN